MTEIQSQVQAAAVILLFAVLGGLEMAIGRWRKPLATAQDRWVEIAIFLAGPVLIVPLVSTIVFTLLYRFAPHLRMACADWPVWLMIITLLLADDLTQYFWHRLSHTSVLWPLHRTHHAAPYMGVRVVYRNNVFYYLMMPGIWLAAVLIYLGFGWVYVGYAIVKMAVIIGAHCEWRWDDALYRHRWLHPLAWVLERVVSTPATHYAHHALTEQDGIGHYNGNFGNLLFLWDVLFGTARITRRLPPEYGLEEDRELGPPAWTSQLFWPLVPLRRAGTPPVNRE